MAFGTRSDPLSSRTNYTVRHDPSTGDWVLLKDGASRAVRRSSSKSALVSQARSIARNNAPSVLTVEGLNGGTTNQNTYD